MRPPQPADAMRGPRQGAKWAPGGASASHNIPATTATSAPMVTFTTLSASVSCVALSHTFSGSDFGLFMDAWCRDKDQVSQSSSCADLKQRFIGLTAGMQVNWNDFN